MAKIKGTCEADVIGTDAVSPGVEGGPASDCADLICGKGGDDRISAGGGDDHIWGGKGDDSLRGEAGDDRLDGGCGLDEAVYAGPRANYEITVAADGTITVRDLNGAADGLDEGTDTLCGIERLRFLGDGDGSAPTTRASTSAGGRQGNGDSFFPSLSADGWVVAFRSDANNLVPGDTNGSFDIFVKNLATGAVTRASTSASGEQANGGSVIPSLSADGQVVAFSSVATNLVPGDTNRFSDVFVKNLATGAITRANTSASGEQANGISGVDPSVPLSADGRVVAFISDATNLVPGDTNGTYDIFVKNLITGAITRASTSASGEQGNALSLDASLSADGKVVAFVSAASNLVPDDTNGSSDIFVKDLTTGAITRVSTSASGEEGNTGSFSPSLSADGRVVAFESYADNLVPGSIDRTANIYVKDLVTGAITRASASASGEQANFDSFNPSLSADGTRVAFLTFADNLVPGDTNGTIDIFVTDLTTGAITRASVSASGEEANGASFWLSLSGNGSRVAFESAATNLVPGDTNGAEDIFVRSLDFDGGDDPGTGEEVYALAPDGALTLLPGTAPHPLADTSPIG